MPNITLTRVPLLVALVLLVLFPLIGSTFYLQLGAKIMIMAIFALSLDLLVGHAGMVSLGHAAYFGVAAYALALISPKYEAANLWLTLPLRDRRGGVGGLDYRGPRGAHRRRLLHHGDPRLCADDLRNFP